MGTKSAEETKAVVLEAFDTLFNKPPISLLPAVLTFTWGARGRVCIGP